MYTEVDKLEMKVSGYLGVAPSPRNPIDALRYPKTGLIELEKPRENDTTLAYIKEFYQIQGYGMRHRDSINILEITKPDERYWVMLSETKNKMYIWITEALA